jgi:hypothetical protein
MKAIQMIETGGPQVLRLVEVPDPTPTSGERVQAHRMPEIGASTGMLMLKP